MEPITLTFNMQKMMKQNVIWTIVLTVLFVSLNIFIQPIDWTFALWPAIKSFFIFCMLYIVLIILHEFFHLAGFVVFGGVPIRSLTFGIKPEQGIAYATTNEVLTNRVMKRALLLPFWTTGVIPTLIGFYVNSYTLIIAGAFLIAGAVGDFMMYKALRQFPNNYYVKDDSTEMKLYVYPTNPTQ